MRSLSCEAGEHDKCLRRSCTCYCGHPARISDAEARRLLARRDPLGTSREISRGRLPSDSEAQHVDIPAPSLAPKPERASEPSPRSRPARAKSRAPSTPNAPRPIAVTEELRDALVAGYVGGTGLEILSRQHGLSTGAIRRVLVARGVEIRPKAVGAGPRVRLDVEALVADYQRGYGLKRLAKLHRCSTGTIRDRLKRAGVTIRPQGDRSMMLPTDEIAVAYTRGASLEELGRVHNVSADTIKRRLQLAGIEPRDHGGDPFAHLDWQRMAREYVEGASTDTLAAAFGCSPQTVIRRLRGMGIELRPQGAKPNGVPARVHLDVAEVTLRYKLGWSIEDLARHYDCSPPTIRARLIAAGVEIRPQGRRAH